MPPSGANRRQGKGLTLSGATEDREKQGLLFQEHLSTANGGCRRKGRQKARGGCLSSGAIRDEYRKSIFSLISPSLSSHSRSEIFFSFEKRASFMGNPVGDSYFSGQQ